MTMADADEKTKLGKACLKEDKFEEAIELLADALQMRVEEFGEVHSHCAEAYYLYGDALVSKAIAESTVFGSGLDSTGQPTSSAAKEDEGEDLEEEEDEKEGGNSDEEDVGAEEDAEDGGDLQYGWECLETARVICEKDDSLQLKLAEVHARLADVSMESENLDGAVQDLQRCVEIRTQLLSEDSRELASTHYQLGSVLQQVERHDLAQESFTQAKHVLQLRIQNITSQSGSVGGSGSSSSEAVEGSEGSENVADLRALVEEIEEKLAEMAEAKDPIANKTTFNTPKIAKLNQPEPEVMEGFGAPTLGVSSSTFDTPSSTLPVKNLGVMGGDTGRKKAVLQPINEAPVKRQRVEPIPN